MVNLELEKVAPQIEKLVLEAIAIIEDEDSFNIVEDKVHEIPITSLLEYIETRLSKL